MLQPRLVDSGAMFVHHLKVGLKGVLVSKAPCDATDVEGGVTEDQEDI